MDHTNHSESCLILPMDREDKAILAELVRCLAPHRAALVERWRKSFSCSAARPAHVTEQLVSEMAEEMIDALVDLPKGGNFNQYFDAMRRLGKKYVRAGVPYTSLVFAIHLYEETNLPIIAGEYKSVDLMQKVLIAQDHLFHNVLALFAAAYYERTLNELQTRTQLLESRTAELEEAQKKRQEFASMVAHELRGPLTVIAGFAKLQEGVATKGGTCDIHVLKRIQSQTRRLERLVCDVADVSLLDSGQFEMVAGECNLVAVARKTVEEQQITTPNHRLTFEASPAVIIGRWDADRVAQAIGNLVSNAIKYSPNGGEVKVYVAERKRQGEACVSVSDQGIGVAARDIPHLFEPFSRLYRERQVKGTGLGLYITRGIIQAHGGRVWVESEEGRGSTFYFSLPLKPHGRDN